MKEKITPKVQVGENRKEIEKEILKCLFECSSWKDTKNKITLGKYDILELDNDGFDNFKNKLKEALEKSGAEKDKEIERLQEDYHNSIQLIGKQDEELRRWKKRIEELKNVFWIKCGRQIKTSKLTYTEICEEINKILNGEENMVGNTKPQATINSEDNHSQKMSEINIIRNKSGSPSGEDKTADTLRGLNLCECGHEHQLDITANKYHKKDTCKMVDCPCKKFKLKEKEEGKE